MYNRPKGTEPWWLSWLAHQSNANLILKVEGSNPGVSISVCNENLLSFAYAFGLEHMNFEILVALLVLND